MPLDNSNISHLPEEAIATATQHVRDILTQTVMHSSNQAALIIYDRQYPLTMALTEAYRRALPDATFIDFDNVEPEAIFAAFKTLIPSDLVVLIQSTSFRLKDFRIRIELFEQSLKVIEHPHLARMLGEEQYYYIDSLAYDANYYRGTGQALKKIIDVTQCAVVESAGERLEFGPLDIAKLNIGDYTGMKNIGGQFPIGEVFTEAKDLESVNGRARIYAFADTKFTVNKPPQPITIVVTHGRVTDVFNSTLEFDEVLEAIRASEGEIWLRELGFGMNRAFTKDRTVSDIGTYERMCGIHLSLGSKHGVYKKPNFKTKNTWFHVDVFAETEFVYLDDVIVYGDGAWCVEL